MIKRGDIYYADLSPVVGSEQGGLRPVLIVQNDVGNRYSPTVIAAAITSRLTKSRLPTHIDVMADKVGLALAEGAGGDVRRAVGLLENAYFSAGFEAGAEITAEHIAAFSAGVGNFNEDTHYDLLGCLQKSIRGSDPDATAFYVAKMLATGDMFPLMRRLQVIASEDIGLAYPQAAAIVRACCESARELGMPEAQIPLIHAAMLLATSPKSNSAYNALHAAMADVEAGMGVNIPVHLQSPLFKGYKYPHEYPGHYVEQQYLPDDLIGRRYYEPCPNKTEQAAAAYWEKIKGGK